MANQSKLASPFRAEYIAGRLRPSESKDALRAEHQGKIERALRDRGSEIIGATELQEDVGPSIIDGEFRDTGWSTGLLKTLVRLKDGPSLLEFLEFREMPNYGNASSWRDRFAACGLVADEYEFVRLQTALTEGLDAGAEFPHFFEDAIDDAKAYPDLDQFRSGSWASERTTKIKLPSFA